MKDKNQYQNKFIKQKSIEKIQRKKNPKDKNRTKKNPLNST